MALINVYVSLRKGQWIFIIVDIYTFIIFRHWFPQYISVLIDFYGSRSVFNLSLLFHPHLSIELKRKARSCFTFEYFFHLVSSPLSMLITLVSIVFKSGSWRPNYGRINFFPVQMRIICCKAHHRIVAKIPAWFIQ